ncbi:MAG: hypothetical protein ACRC63_01040, partial [Metamycoplasmataceae bacterium]
IAVISLFALGLASQASAIKLNTIPLSEAGEIDKLNIAIQTQKALLIYPGASGILTPSEQIINNEINNTINTLTGKKDEILNSDNFMKILNDYLIQF